MYQDEELRRLFGRNVAYWRHKRGMTQSVLAELCDITDVALSRIENGSSWFKEKTFNALVSALNVSPHVLFLDESNTGSSIKELYIR